MSPLPVDRLTKDSPLQAVREAVGASIQQCMDEPNDKTQEDCAGMAFSIAREKSGQALDEATQR